MCKKKEKKLRVYVKIQKYGGRLNVKYDCKILLNIKKNILPKSKSCGGEKKRID